MVGDQPAAGAARVTMIGWGSESAPPDRVVLALALEARDGSRERAHARVAGDGRRLSSALDALEVPGPARTTTGIVVAEALDERGRPDGFRARTRVSLRLPADFPLGELIARAVGVGAAVEGPSWELSPQHPARLLALRQAVADARARAAAAAAELGLNLGELLEVRDRAEGRPTPMRRVALHAAAPVGKQLPIDLGEQVAEAVVEVVFALRSPSVPT
ncbi:MAG: SIMPL domain-containing protein [Candidatus Dormibacteria bacterium]